MIRIDLNDWHEQALNDDPADIAANDLEGAAEWIFVMLDEESLERTTGLNDKTNTMRKYPELVAAHALAHGISRFECTYRTLKVEELRLLGSIADSLKTIASAAESAKGKSNE